jgi:hypothetical protein
LYPEGHLVIQIELKRRKPFLQEEQVEGEAEVVAVQKPLLQLGSQPRHFFDFSSATNPVKQVATHFVP